MGFTLLNPHLPHLPVCSPLPALRCGARAAPGAAPPSPRGKGPPSPPSREPGCDLARPPLSVPNQVLPALWREVWIYQERDPPPPLPQERGPHSQPMPAPWPNGWEHNFGVSSGSNPVLPLPPAPLGAAQVACSCRGTRYADPGGLSQSYELQGEMLSAVTSHHRPSADGRPFPSPEDPAFPAAANLPRLHDPGARFESQYVTPPTPGVIGNLQQLGDLLPGLRARDQSFLAGCIAGQ